MDNSCAGNRPCSSSRSSRPRPLCRCKTSRARASTSTSGSAACTRTRPSTTSTNDSHVRPLLSLFSSSTPPTSSPPEHARYVYDVQKDSDQTDSEPEPEEEDASDGESSARRRGRSSRRIRSGKKRMSIVTSRFFDVPRLPPEFERELLEDELEDGCGHMHAHGGGNGRKRRFFQSGAQWDPIKRQILERQRAGVGGMGMGTFEAAQFRMAVPVPVSRARERYSEEGDEAEFEPDGEEDDE